ncbi:hypothetical protein B0T25DRAFT_69253 [Lasiosphaeria hispida]|uniref:Uncharacterized protein n=1 Tax=Lasiosphaeria hispida TaxID=260671 RepID=A0AAJ0ML82_9PEZI|nr:hypothetical protein B0T25DRAFT_69253 [Lasiosphaeria hispida]
MSSSSGGAQFVSDGAPMVTSYQPCHVFGDSGLYNVGTRASYYLQYAAALLSVLFLGGRDLKMWFLSFLPLTAANFVVLTLNAGGDGLVILDWAIVFGLVFWSIVFLIRPILSKRYRGGGAVLAKDASQLQTELAREGGRMVSSQEAEWHVRYVAVLKVLIAEAGEQVAGHQETREAEGRRKQEALEVALQAYVNAFATARGSPTAAEAASYILDVYDDGRVRDVATRLMIDNRQVESFRDIHAEALRLANIPFDQARGTTQTLARVAMEELDSRNVSRPALSTWQAVRSFQTWAGITGMVSCGLGLAFYSGYSAFMVWLLFRGVDKGARSGCNVQIIFFVVPISVYNYGAITALRVFACIWLAFVALPALFAGVVLFVVGLDDWWVGTQPSGSVQKPGPGFRAVPYDSEKGKEVEIPDLSPITRRASRTSDLYEMSEFPPSSSAARTQKQRKHSDPLPEEPEPSGSGLHIRGGDARKMFAPPPWLETTIAFLRENWEYILVLPVAHTIVVVEVTIRINGLDMGRRPMTSMGELLAFFLGAGLFLRVLARCFHKGVRRLRRRKARGWVGERWVILRAPAGRVEEVALGKEVSVGEGSERMEGEERKKQRRIYLQPERSGSSMGRFRELIDEDDEG